MDKERKREDEDMEDLYDDPILDAFYTTICRSDEAEWRKKELSRGQKRILK